MKLRCFARCERRGECRGAVKGSIALQSRLTMIDRSREPCLNALPLMLQHACGERSDRVQGLSALARYQGARSPLAESEAAPQVDPAKPQRKNPQRSCGALPGMSDAANAAERPKGLLRCNPG